MRISQLKVTYKRRVIAKDIEKTSLQLSLMHFQDFRNDILSLIIILHLYILPKDKIWMGLFKIRKQLILEISQVVIKALTVINSVIKHKIIQNLRLYINSIW